MTEFKVSHIDPVGLSMPPSDIYVAINTDDIGKKLGASLEQLQLAARRAAKRVRDRLQTFLMREQSARTGVPQKKLKKRYRKKENTQTGQKAAWSNTFASAILWIGVNPIDAQEIGQPRQLKMGAKVKKHFFDRAFIADIYGPGEKIWRRKGAELGHGRGAAKWPVIKMTLAIDQEMEDLLKKYEPIAARWFEREFEHQLKFAMGFFN